MPITLYPHSQRAYNSVLSLLPATRKAAVIHPTGTGKSFIAFKLTQEFKDRRFVWLSPSEIIYLTQRQKVREKYGYVPENVVFSTYAKIGYTSDEELKEWKPDFIILDEFHRCGAKEWGAGVKRVLNMYPNAMLVGLSATNIRYLDNRRDMATELFDGCVADQMSLAEAIEQGILPAPKYVIALYSYDDELERLGRRIRQGGAIALRSAQSYYERLRRALDEAPAFGEIFNRHIPDPCGRYIVFCSSVKQLKSMAARAKTDFSPTDPNPHIYRVYDSSPTAKRNFESFKSDESRHLKLLFCVDMLNEGVHVEGLSGVMLFRPTVSPIIYKQQIGRALSVGDGHVPVIFDIVNNFDSLYTLSAVEGEINSMARMYQKRHREYEVGRFEITDELADCRALLGNIEAALSSTWDAMYEMAKEYFDKNGNLNVPKGYRTANDGLPLGMWIATQRRLGRGAAEGSLSEERKRKLDEIGMVWEESSDRLWGEGFSHAADYYEENGNLDVPSEYASKDGYRLGQWIQRQRMRKSGRGGRRLKGEQEKRLNDIGMIWSRVDYSFEQGCLELAKYKEEHGNVHVPYSYVTDDGFRLGRWLADKKSLSDENQKLTSEQKKRLEALGVVSLSRRDEAWNNNFGRIKEYLSLHGDLAAGRYYRYGGTCIHRWLSDQRDKLALGKLSEDRKKRMETLGPAWSDWLKEHPRKGA